MYERMATSAKRWSDGLNILAGLLGAVVGTTGVVAIAADTSSPLWQRIVSVVLGFLTSAVATLSSTWRLDETQMNDVLTQVSYASLGRDLMFQLAQSRRDRPDAQEYMKAKLGEIEQLRVSAPVIDAAVRGAYNRKFRNNPIYSPEDQWDATLADARAGAPDGPPSGSEDYTYATQSVSPSGSPSGSWGGPPGGSPGGSRSGSPGGSRSSSPARALGLELLDALVAARGEAQR